MNKEQELQAVLSVIARRKSVRSFVHGQGPSKEELLTIAKAGMAAPTSRNSQPWKFILINDPVSIRRIAEKATYAGMIADGGAAILLAAEPRKSPKETPDVWIQDLAAASENILLAVEAMGYGACWCQIYNMEQRTKDFRDIFNFPEPVIPFNLICIGKPTGFDSPINKWNEVNVMWNEWRTTI
jgi:nitroreductase